ncbi:MULTISPECIES: hypothetical protein [unclassified Methanoculleus]|uniref:hypothetical protein n=3 Tax=Methanoculleus TaxID=45989 RepID=UPI0025DD57E3|nr:MULTISPECIES: hypothetical protein [unclassified Methanoculleus]MCK9318313.1 hypothetical protein [Methanoculleus sp.]MDD2786535.1 hypothetical protein [Methanoculleus sp.]MDD3215616.1 hypothetical protein [Methanoculleus sp.]MDD4313464.1 hypothetical protein [Methanoculleus sp.]MDD4469964.1 hypothetical protein [Methanoculleus sp.]
MKRGPISTGTATVCAIIIATVMMTVVAGVLLLSGETARITVPGVSPASPVEAVASHAGTPVIRITGSTINFTECRVYLTDPDGVLHNVETAILGNATLADGRAAYIFCLLTDDPAASGYWITDEPNIVFSAAYHPGVRPFSPDGEWRVVVYDRRSMKNRIDRVVPINGPSSPD